MCQVKVCFTTKPAFKSSLKDGIPTHQRANVIYHFMCRYGSRYVGKTTHRLEARIGQRIPSYLNQPGKAKDWIPASAIGEFLACNGECLDKFDSSEFTSLATARTQTKLDTLEALYIKKLTQD